MSSTFLNQIGLGEFDMGYLLIGMGAVILLLIIFLILLIVQIRKTSKLKIVSLLGLNNCRKIAKTKINQKSYIDLHQKHL